MEAAPPVRRAGLLAEPDPERRISRYPAGPDQQSAVSANLTDTKDRTAFHMMGGVQAQYQRFSVFGQATYMPAQSRFLFNGRSTYFLEGGLRFNVAKSRSGP